MTIGKLNVMLGLNSGQFDTKMVGSGARVRTLKTEVQASTFTFANLQTGITRITAAVGAMGAAVTAVAVGAFVILRNEMEKIDAMGKQASKLGIDPEQFVGLAHAGNLAGVEIENLETAITKMEKGLSEAATKGGPVADVLAQLGLDAQTMADMSPDQALYVLADALDGVANQGDKVRIAMALFGRTGADMLPMLQDGSRGLREMQRDAEQLGLTFSQADFRQVEMANDAIERLETSFGALKRQAAIGFAPLFATIADTITEAMIKANSAVNDHVNALGQAGDMYGLVAESVFYLADRLDLAAQGIQLTTLKIQDLTMTAMKGSRALAEMLGQDQLAADLSASIAAIERSMLQTTLSIGMDFAFDPTSLGDKMRARYQEILDKVNQAGEKPKGGLVDLDALEEEQKAMDDLRRRGEQLATSLRTPQEVLGDRIRDANQLLASGAIGWGTYQREIEAVRKEVQQLAADLEELTGPKLIEEGTQEFYAAMDRFRAEAEAAKKPVTLPATIFNTDPRAAIEAAQEQAEEVRRFVDDWNRAHPLPGLDTSMSGLSPAGRIAAERGPSTITPEPIVPTLDSLREQMADWIREHPLPEQERTRADDIPRMGRADDFRRDNAEQLGQLLDKTDAVIDRLDTIAAETGRTTNHTKDTVKAVERIQVPETVEM